MRLEKIGFIGLGLIGGSIAIKLKELHPDCKIYATSHGAKTIHTAHQKGIIENSEPLAIEAFGDFDLIFLCAPVEKNIEYLSQLKDVISGHTLITDVGSTKTKIHKKVTELGLEESFIGGHPMTGSEKTGIDYANPMFLENAYYIITPTAKTTGQKLSEFRDLVASFGSIPYVLDYQEHDQATAAISHLPHMIAFSLTNMIKEIDDDRETMKSISAGSFRDMTRVAASSPEMWESITSSNRDFILELMDRYLKSFTDLRESIQNYNGAYLKDYFAEAKEYRDSLNMPSRKAKSLVHEVYLDLNDEAGQIAIISALIAFRGISIKNIGIVNNREFSQGVLRIEFYDEKAKEQAIAILKERNYTLYY